jgi:ABC-type multidrug transport system fused ATPase/permease subunit
VLVPVIAVCQLDQSLSQHHLWNCAQVDAMNVRSGVTTLIYCKCLRLRLTDIIASNSEVVNLISTDTEKLVQSMYYFHWLWASILEILICIALSASAIGWSALGGLLVMVVMIPIQGKLGKRIGVLRRQMVQHTDRRVRAMSEILEGIKIIKLFGWEATFVERVIAARADEIVRHHRHDCSRHRAIGYKQCL